MRELPEIRQDINRVDSAIRELFLLRMSLALEVAKTKAQSDDKIYKPDREAEIVEKRSAGMEEELQLKYVSLLQSMIRASREYQYSEILRQVPEKFPFKPSESLIEPKTVFYQGVPGAYQELAARALFPRCEPQNVPTWEQVFQSVRDGKADIGVVPVENTTAGTVSEVYDLLLDYDLYINRSYIKKISHCLAAVPGTKLEDVKRVARIRMRCRSATASFPSTIWRPSRWQTPPSRPRTCRKRATRALLPSAHRRRLCATVSIFSPRASTTCSTTKHALSPSAER